MADKITIDRAVVEQAIELMKKAWNTTYSDTLFNDFRDGEITLRAALDQPALAQQPAVPPGMTLVNSGALQMVINTLRRDAEQGKPVRGEMADELLNAAPEAPAQVQTDQRESKAEVALNKVLNVVQRYLPPDGLNINDAMSEIIGIVDPWPLDTQPEATAAQKEQP